MLLFTCERILVNNGVDKEDSHSPSVVRGGDGLETLLPRRVPNLELDYLPVEIDGADLKIDPDGRDERGVEGILGKTDQKAALSHGRIADHEQL